MASLSFATMGCGRRGPLVLLSSPPAFVGVLQATPQRWPLCDHRCSRKRNATLLLSSSSKSSSGSSGGGSSNGDDSGSGGEAQHSEQRAGFRPPLPLEEDGHVVDLLSLEDLFDSGALRVVRRRDDYRDRRTDGYTEPLEVYVLGTSHASATSAADVRRVVGAVRPQSVVVELCKSRAGLMMPVADDNDSVNPLAMSGDGFASTLARSIRLGGQSTALLRAALAWAAQVSLGDDPDGSKPAAAAMYGDFKAAKEGAEEMEAQIVLGDRPVEVTLQRAWEALSLGERFDLGRILLGLAFHRAGMGDGGGEGGEGGSNAAEELLKRRVSAGEVEDDTLEVLIAMLGERFPSVVGPLIFERDLYLAWTLKRSRAVCGQRRVVGVVGRGHLAGVMRAIDADRGGDTLVFKELTGDRGGGGGGGSGKGGGTTRSNVDRGLGLAKFAARIAAETAAGYALWELYKIVTAA